MKEVRVALADVQPGEMVVAIGKRPVGARFKALHPCRAGSAVRGPRGGMYRLTVAGARRYVIVETYAGRPLVPSNATAVVLRDTEEE